LPTVDIVGVASAAGQVASALFALPAGVIAYFAWRTSVNSAKATEVLTSIEKTRLHAELRPQFDVQIRKEEEGHVVVLLRLVGPAALHRLDSVQPAVRPFFADQLGDLTFEDRWEPYEFTTSKLEPSRTEYVAESEPLTLGEARIILLVDAFEATETSHPAWPKIPIRLNLTCKYQDFDPWIVPLTITPPTT
jgi:hypothetical protein